VNEGLMQTILRGFLPNGHERFHYAKERLETEMFSGPHRDLYELVSAFESTTGELLDAAALTKVLESSKRMPVEQLVQIQELWQELQSMRSVTEPDFKASISLLTDAYKEDRFQRTLTTAAEIALDGKTVDGRTWTGLEDAIDFVGEEFAGLEYVGGAKMPEGDIREEYGEIMAELQQGSAIKRFRTGIVPLDELTHGGPGTGELWIVGAYTGVGKSTVCINMARQFILDGHNVLYLSLETQRSQIRRRLIARHAFDDMFGIGGVSLDSLNKHSVEKPILKDEDIARFSTAAKDLTENPKYGSIIIAQVPENSSFNTIRAICKRHNQKKPIHVIIIDSIDLIGSDRKRRDKRDELNEVIMASKGLAMGFDNGRGVPVITPWQIKMEAHMAVTRGDRSEYDITDFGDSVEIQRKADFAMSLLAKKDMDRATATVHKWRDGKSGLGFDLDTNLDRSYIGSTQSLKQSDDDPFEEHLL
jgi:replicative DNA helicase